MYVNVCVIALGHWSSMHGQPQQWHRLDVRLCRRLCCSRLVLLDRQDVRRAGPGQELLLIGWGHCRLQECCAVEHGGTSTSTSTSTNTNTSTNTSTSTSTSTFSWRHWQPSTDAGAASGSSSTDEASAHHLAPDRSAAEDLQQAGAATWQQLLGSQQPSGGCYLVGHLLPTGPSGRPAGGSRPAAVHWVPALLPGASALGRAVAEAPAPDPAAQGPSLSMVQEQLQRLQEAVLAAAQHHGTAAGGVQAVAAAGEVAGTALMPGAGDSCDSSTAGSWVATVGCAGQPSPAEAASDTPQQSQVSSSTLQCSLLQLVSYSQPLSARVVADKDDVLCQVAPCSVKVHWAVGSPALAGLQQGELLQLQRCGFYRVDWLADCAAPSCGPPRVLRLIQVPQK
jgi:hypothetical protein